jgi:hypothetical protein
MAKKEMHSEKSEMKMDKAQDKAMIKKAFRQHDIQEHKGGKGTKLALKKGGSAAMCYGGKVKKMASGGRVKKMADGGGTSPFGNTPLGGLGGMLGGFPRDPNANTPSYGGGNQGGAFGGLQNVNQGANQIGQSLGTIQGALGVGGGAQSQPNFGEPQYTFKKGGKVMKMAKGGKVKKMLSGGVPAPQSLTMSPTYGGGNQGGAYGGLDTVNKGSAQVGQSLGTIQGALGGGRGLGSVAGGQTPYDPGFKKKGGMIKAKKMAAGGMAVDPRAAAMAAKKAAMAAPMGAKRGMPIAGRAMPPMAATPKGKPMVGRMPPEANMPVPTMKKGGMTKMGAVKTKPGNINGVAKKGLTKGKMVKMAAGGSVGSASRRGDGCAIRGKTKA